jgi:hypothetical protein
MSSVSMPGMSDRMPATMVGETGARRHRIRQVDLRQQLEDPRQLRVDHRSPLFPFRPAGLFGLQAGAGVDADRLGVHVGVGQQLDGQRGELGA